MKPQITLTPRETADVKKVAISLLEKLRLEKLVLNWRKQQTTRAMALVTIQENLDGLPRMCLKDFNNQKCGVVYQHFYIAYMGQGKSAYAEN
jgi:type I restriction enzyme R subunit